MFVDDHHPHEEDVHLRIVSGIVVEVRAGAGGLLPHAARHHDEDLRQGIE